MRKLLSTLSIFVLTAVLMVGSTGLAQATWVSWYGANEVPIYTSWFGYTTSRNTSYSPYGIWFVKADGPSMRARWIVCGTDPGGSSSGGPKKTVSNSDPAPGVYLRTNGSAPLAAFCLAFISDSGSNDTFTGDMEWDGYYN